MTHPITGDELVSAIAPVRKEVLVNASAEHAFRVFTDGVSSWWPKQHHIGASPLKRMVIEPTVNGRWYSICEDDTQCDSGKVLAWDPPRRLVLAWQIAADWKYDPSFLTEVEVTFVAKGPAQTLVTLEHRDLDRFGPNAAETRQAIDSEGGWGLILSQFVDAAQR